jgi:hypothetical protein
VLAWQGFDGRLRRYSRGAMSRPSIWPRWRMATEQLARAARKVIAALRSSGRFRRNRADPVHAVQQATQRGVGAGDRSRQVHLQQVRASRSSRSGATRTDRGRRQRPRGPGCHRGIPEPARASGRSEAGTGSGAATGRAYLAFSGTTRQRRRSSSRRPRCPLAFVGSDSEPAGPSDDPWRSLAFPCGDRLEPGPRCRFGAIISWKLASITAGSCSSSTHSARARVSPRPSMSPDAGPTLRRAESTHCLCRVGPDVLTARPRLIPSEPDPRQSDCRHRSRPRRPYDHRL